ncbi:class I SAM-dependent methyltransferase [Pelagibacteraceae bacterium]|nr:class I SAM-dependent methyltransferase [Pelagibacteraceae bacterium]
MKQKKIFFFKRLLYYIYGEKFFKRFNYDWSQYPSRIEIIKKIIKKEKYKSYLEIGCDNDENFSQIIIENKVGVDPLKGGTMRMTSDDFFIKNKKSFDMIFLDGLHTYEQTIKDIDNSLNFLNKKGVIVIHDCLPKKIWNQIVPRVYGHWNGDVWKAIVHSRTYDHADSYTCIADHGLGLIFKRKNKDRLELKEKNFKNLKFADYYNNHNKYMNLISYEELEKTFNNN